MKIGIVSSIDNGHNGPFANMYYNNIPISFSLLEPVWQEGEKIPAKGDWVLVDDVRFHGTNPEKLPHRRAYFAKFPTEEEMEVFLKNNRMEELQDEK